MRMIARIKILLVVRLIYQTISRTSLPSSSGVILCNRVDSEMAEASAWDALFLRQPFSKVSNTICDTYLVFASVGIVA
jgi:hypothetical protein